MIGEEQQHLLPPAYIVTMESQEESEETSFLCRHFRCCPESRWRRRCRDRCYDCHEAMSNFYAKYDFPVHIVLSILVAYLYPPLGAVYLHPDLTASVGAVLLVFVIVGLGLKTSDLATACCRRVSFNAFVQLYNFFFASTLAVTLCKSLTRLQLLNEALATGIIVCSCLPIAINALIVLTASAGGDEAVAVFNTVASNVIGIFLSPILIVSYLGGGPTVHESERSMAAAATSMLEDSPPLAQHIDDDNPLLNVRAVFSNLLWIVVSPMLLGWFLHNYVDAANQLYVSHKRKFKKAQESCLVYIVYCTFCRKWLAEANDVAGSGATVVGMSDVAFMVLLEGALMATLMGVAWLSLGLLFPREPELRVTGLFACHHKTIALGVPLIGSLYKGHPDLALYTLPILVWHPLQLVVGSMLVPALHSYIRRERTLLIATSSTSAASPQHVSSSSKTMDDDDHSGIDENETDHWTESTAGLLHDDASSRSSTPQQPSGGGDSGAGGNSTYGSIQVIDV